MKYKFENGKMNVCIIANDNNAYIEGGSFGGITLLKTPIFTAEIKDVNTGEKTVVTSEDSWSSVKALENGGKTEFIFKDCGIFKDICVIATVTELGGRLEWGIEVENTSIDYSVMEITYPTPAVTAERYNYFVPLKSGFLIEDAQNEDYENTAKYPGAYYTMQYLAVYGEDGGVYIGIEDKDASVKRFSAKVKNGVCTSEVAFYGIGATLAQNSFRVSGRSVWQYLDGDWYDAAMIYADFVKKEATWLPEIDDNGRVDVAEKYKNIPFWVSDYIPNTPSQGDNKPMNLSAGSDIYDADYWYKAPMQLQKELGVPIAYHVYNWHEIPFNIEYPHFMPAKKVFMDHAKELRENNIYVFPYINSVAWEVHDAEMGHEVNFDNTGYKCAVVMEDGSFEADGYPQVTTKGEKSSLARCCGTSEIWQKYIYDLSREMEEKLDIDGIYYDEIAASQARPCFNREHKHAPGGGSYWAKGYNKLMQKVRADRPKESFYFTECNAEPYMKDFDGYLTWEWVEGNEVPAFVAVYAGYVQLLGRCTIGTKKNDFGFFKYCTAKSFLCGQQLGWCKADIVYSDKHLEFLKSVAATRYRYSELFNSSRLLRPPVVKTNMPKYTTPAGLWFDKEIVSEYVLSSAWQPRNGKKTVIFAINIGDNDVEYDMTFDIDEFGIRNKALPTDFEVDGSKCRVSGTLKRYELKIWEI